jgi:hypothetical protein
VDVGMAKIDGGGLDCKALELDGNQTMLEECKLNNI